MPLADARRRSWGLVALWVALTLACLVPIWCARALPMLDAPDHLALARGWHNYGDPDWNIAAYFQLRVRPLPYILFYATIHALLYVFPIELANKIFLSGYVILYPLSFLALARALGRNPWLALSAFAFVFNPAWIYGFQSYLMSVATYFFALAALLIHLRSERPWALPALFVLTFLCYFGHALTWVLFGLSAIPILHLHRQRLRACLWAAVAMLPSVAVGLIAYDGESHERAFVTSSTSRLQGSWRDLPTAIGELPKRVLELFPGPIDMIVLGGVMAALVGLLWWRRQAPLGTADRASRVVLLLLGLLSVLYLILPYGLEAPLKWWYIAPRLPVLLFQLAWLLPRERSLRHKRWLLLPVVLGVLVVVVKLTVLYRDFDRRNRPFFALVDQLPLGRSVMVIARGTPNQPEDVERSGDPATSAPVYWHFYSWPMALKGGYTPFVFDQGIPIRPRQPVLKSPAFLEFDNFNIRLAPDFEYYLMRDPDPSMFREPSIKVAGREEPWVLFQRIHQMTDEP